MNVELYSENNESSFDLRHGQKEQTRLQNCREMNLNIDQIWLANAY
jgi:hypothetical protein